MEDRNFQKKKAAIENFIKKNKTVDHARILNEIDIDYDTLMNIIRDLKHKGKIS
ncbi:MAG: hypothetical protein ACE5SW_03160 [Nitrososphaeraceae archaeon]